MWCNIVWIFDVGKVEIFMSQYLCIFFAPHWTLENSSVPNESLSQTVHRERTPFTKHGHNSRTSRETSQHQLPLPTTWPSRTSRSLCLSNCSCSTAMLSLIAFNSACAVCSADSKSTLSCSKPLFSSSKMRFSSSRNLYTSWENERWCQCDTSL